MVSANSEVNLPSRRSCLGPAINRPPPLVGCGGPWLLRKVVPYVDHVELKTTWRATQHGSLQLDVLASVTKEELAKMVDTVRQQRPTLPISVLVVVGVGDSPETVRLEEKLQGSFMGQFFGSSAKVVDALGNFGELGVDRIQISELTEGSLEALAPTLLADEAGLPVIALVPFEHLGRCSMRSSVFDFVTVGTEKGYR